MIKHTLLAILFFTCSIGFSQELNITNNLPSTAAAGQAISAEYTLTKAATMGSFAKFQLDLPAGFQAQSTELKGGNFTFENNRVKIVWVSLPGDASFMFTFKLTSPATTSGNVTLAPQFFYLENSIKKEYTPTPVIINFGGSPVTDNTAVVTQPATSTTDNTSATPDNTNTSIDNTTAPATVSVPSTTDNSNANTTSQPATTNPTQTETAKTTTAPVVAKSNVVYHVQLAALTNKPGKSKFAEYGPITIVEDAGLYKVLVGTFKTLEDARKYKAQLIAKGTVGCFVVAYENGSRIKI